MTVRLSLFLVGVLCALITTMPALAQANISQEQIEQFRKLPKAQQEMLARQYGFDLSLLNNQSKESDSQNQAQTVFPRGTTFDENGDPIIPEDIESQFEVSDEELQLFGYRAFSGEPSTFAPASSMSVPADYVLGQGDSLQVNLFGKSSESFSLTINSEGQIVIPELGPLQIAGMRYQEAQTYIKQQVSERLIGQTAVVSMDELRSIQVFVSGEAYKPGSYTVSALTTITQALFVSGGISEIASLRNIQLKRGGETISQFDLYDLLIEGDASDDRVLQSGDVIHIPARTTTVSVDGEVLRPAIYEVLPGEDISDVMEMAGGLLPTAYRKSIAITRVFDGYKSVVSVDYTENTAASVSDGDFIQVRAVADDVQKSVMLVGAAARPGYYQWREGLRVNDILHEQASALLPITDLSYGVVLRRANFGKNIKVLQFDVTGAIQGGDENLKLAAGDRVVLFSQYEDKEKEKLQLQDWLLTETERTKRERQEMLKEYRNNYLTGLLKEQKRLLEEGNLSSLTQQDGAGTQEKLRGLFTQQSDDNPEDEEIETYSDFSRTKLLEPVLNILRNQFTQSGSLPLVFVDGEVRFPGVYPLPENATAEDLIAAAGGLKESAYLARAEITRTIVNSDEAQTEYIPFSLFDELMGNQATRIVGRDRLNVFSIPEWQNTLEVTLEGEVRFPGTYAIRRGETLDNLIERAGGLTPFAAADGAVFTREELKEQERKRLESLARDLQREIATNSITNTGDTVLSYADTRQLLRDLASVEPVGRMVIDLPEILSGEEAADLVLKDGDRLVIPQQQNTINIIGEVQLASSYRFDSSVSVDEYIARAGGMKEKADDERIYIVKADGSVTPASSSSWFSLGAENLLQPGDTIVVPLDTQYTDNMTLWRDSTQILYQIGVALAAINGL